MLWDPIDISQVHRLVFRHCSALDMPASLHLFSSLKSLKVFNSTISKWEALTSALTAASHPLLRSLQFVPTNFSAMELPTGLWPLDFPRQVTVIELCWTNVKALPPSVSARWPRQLRLAWEGCDLANVPAVLLEMEPTELSLARNPLTSVPASIFTLPALESLSLASTPLTSLPGNLTLSSAFQQLSIVESKMSDMRSWFDEDLLMRPQRSLLSENLALFAGQSPYCKEIARRDIKNGERIVCASTRDDISYPLGQEDAQSALTNANNWLLIVDLSKLASFIDSQEDISRNEL
ncbi:hypothetical protein Poli38472_008043 [Pythium oligandrum]|uniref:Uncharacterized protein n=1 Tax=Pythium oligandrum TaxID=41045 RepID=A0A8K1FJX4_PYTOL|nr:hypothetical protein Poli38472_008043 [Pythium oligandrum]|eukprot:TMW65401.1 hypothetical protein Poli38472_008043 [Pythium oligandrum]